MTRLKIAVVGTRGMPDVHGGVERHCEELYPRLAAAGVDVTVFARSAYVTERSDWRGVHVVPLPAPEGRSTETIVHTLRAIRAARKLAPDVIHCHSVGPAGVLPLARAMGMRCVLTVHALDYMQSKWGAVASAYLRYGEWAGLRAAHECIAVAKWMAEDLGARSGRSVTYIPNGPLAIAAASGDETVRRLGVEPGSYALFVGRLVPDKRVEDLMAAAAEHPSIPVVVVGDTSHTDEYAARLKGLAGANVVFAGYRYGTQLDELYAHAGVFVLPSAVEGLPLSLLEAMSIGLPCVASDIPANREVLGSTPWLFPLGDRAALRHALVEARALDGASREARAEVARARVQAEYDWDRIAEATLRVLSRASRS